MSSVRELLRVYDSGFITTPEVENILIAGYDYLIGQIEDMANMLYDAGIKLPSGVEFYVVLDEEEGTQ